MKHKIAIWVKDGVIQGTRSNIDIELEIIDIDSNMSRRMGRWPLLVEWSDYALINADTRDAAEAKWKTSETELPFEIY